MIPSIHRYRPTFALPTALRGPTFALLAALRGPTFALLAALRGPTFALAAALLPLGCAQPSPTSTPAPVTSPVASATPAATSPSSAPPAGPPPVASAAASSPPPTPPAHLAEVDFFVTTLAVIGLQAPCPCPDAVAFHRVGQKLLVQAEQMYFEISPGGKHLQRAPETLRPLPYQAGASRANEAPQGLVSPQSAAATDGTLWLLRDRPASDAAPPRTSQLLRRSPSGEWAQVRLHYPGSPLGDDVILSDLLVDGSSVWVIGFSLANPKKITVWTLQPV